MVESARRVLRIPCVHLTVNRPMELYVRNGRLLRLAWLLMLALLAACNNGSGGDGGGVY